MSRSLYFVGGMAAVLLIVLAARVAVVPAAISDHAARSSAAPRAPGDAVAAAVDDLGAWPGSLAP